MKTAITHSACKYRGIYAHGDTLQNIEANIKEAIEQKLATMDKEDIEAALDVEIITTTMKVDYAPK